MQIQIQFFERVGSGFTGGSDLDPVLVGTRVADSDSYGEFLKGEIRTRFFRKLESGFGFTLSTKIQNLSKIDCCF